MIALVAVFACAPPDTSRLTKRVDVEATDATGAGEAFAAVVDSAEATLRIAVPALEDAALAEAIVAAHERGVDVQVVTDVDRAVDPGVAILDAAEIDVRLADGAVGYFDFSVNLDVAWESADVKMSHAFAIADGLRWVGASEVGSAADGARIALSGADEEVAEDLGAEFVQLFGGSDATALTAYSGMAKSIADPRWRYGTHADADLELWLGPQERLVKRVIDATYAARHSVWILTDDFASDGLARALQDKAATGFDVQVIVGPSFGTASATLSSALEDDAPDVVKLRWTGAGRVPTIVVVDAEPSLDSLTRTMVITHDLYGTTRTYRGSEVPNDQLIDGAMWVIDTWGDTSLDDPLHETWDAHLAATEPL